MKKILKKQFPVIGIFAFLAVFSVCSSASRAGQSNIEVIKRGAGAHLGTVQAEAAVSEDRETGKITGDTGKYGFVENIPVSRVTTGKKPDKKQENQNSIPANAAEIAYTNAVYEIIQQVKKMGGDAVTDVVSNVDRNYDPDTKIETVYVRVSAAAVKLKK